MVWDFAIFLCWKKEAVRWILSPELGLNKNRPSCDKHELDVEKDTWLTFEYVSGEAVITGFLSLEMR